MTRKPDAAEQCMKAMVKLVDPTDATALNLTMETGADTRAKNISAITNTATMGPELGT